MITRLINYMFHQYQKRKYPFLFLNLKLSTESVDVNCSPDKREIILRNENLVLATIKASLIEIFRSVRSVSTIENNKLPSVQFKLENSFLTVKTNSGHNSFVSEECTVTIDTPEVSSMKSSSITETLNENGFLCSRTSTQKTEVSTSCDGLFEEECVTTVQYEDNPAACNSRADQSKKIIFDDNKRCYNEHRSQTVIDVGILVDKIEPKEGKRREARDLFQEKHNEILKFRAALDPAQNENAEKELRQQISREMFSKMEVVGQLNKSFIVVHMESDLFIIDQHAADEIYNFENLMKSSTIPNQRLVAYVTSDAETPPCQRIQLTAVPVSKLWTYGKDDVIELIAMLEECPDVICRPSRIRAMFASRACRKSVMMGSSLTHSIMRNIVDHLGTLDEPWGEDCEHLSDVMSATVASPTQNNASILSNCSEHFLSLLTVN
ncbi:Putative DNA mismatch repair protein pms2 [Gryllus bimaculatus]|nr:Putative DNA mismatch repair protein pms2 [Gryllus bimaculatus]